MWRTISYFNFIHSALLMWDIKGKIFLNSSHTNFSRQLRKIGPHDKLLPWDTSSNHSEKCHQHCHAKIALKSDKFSHPDVKLQGVFLVVTHVKVSLNAPRCMSRSIDIHQIVDNAKEPINYLHHHNQEMLWKTEGCNKWKEKVSS